MKLLNKSRLFVVMILVLFSSAMCFSYKQVEANACSPGSYAKFDSGTGKFACTQIGSSKMKNDVANMSNASDINKLNWAQKGGRLAIAFSIEISYATEIVALVMIVYAAFLYTTSDGEMKRIRQAKMFLLYAFIGMFIASFALVISKLIGGVLGG